MATDRIIVESSSAAREELGNSRSTPAWRETSHTLPFGELTGNEFEVLCFLLLKAEFPEDRIVYYGKTADLGRDIVHTTNEGTVRLIQCKKYSKNVDKGEVREELAKLFVNVFSGNIPIRPDEVCFYVVPDLTSPAKDLIESQSEWQKVSGKALFDFFGQEPSVDLKSFANEWWPLLSSQHDISLTYRCRAVPSLLDEFFRIRKVIDASLKDVQEVVHDEVKSLREELLGVGRAIGSAPEPLGADAISSAFAIASRLLLTWPATLGNDECIERPELTVLFERVIADTASTTLLLGARGTGKSALLATLGKRLTLEQRCLLAIKCDLLDRSIDSEAKLSEFLRLPALLTNCVFEASATTPVVILLDQLDALGDLLDLHSGRLNVLLDLIAKVHRLSNVHIVVSCRDFEYRHDVRLSGIEAEEMQLQLPPWERVCEILKSSRNIDAANWPEPVRESLRVPQHLKMLLEHLAGSTEYDVSRSYQQLLDDVWELHVANSEGPTGRSALLIEMARAMADREELWLPIAAFDDRLPLISALEGADILYRPANRSIVGFRHQTLFEHALARAYASGDARFVTHVLERQSALFVRPAIWSTLRYLREVNRRQYVKELNDLCEAEIRLHVLYLLIEFIGQVDEPIDDEQLILQRWIDNPKYRDRCLLSIAGNPGWFARLRETHIPVLMQLPVNDSWPTVVLLRSAWPFASDKCLQLLRNSWLPDMNRDMLSINVFRDLTSWDDETVGEVCKIVDRTDMEEFRIFDIAQAVSAGNAELAPRVIKTRLQRELRLLYERPKRIPSPLAERASDIDRAIQHREYDDRNDIEQLLRHRDGFYELPAIAEAAPGAFLDEIWPWFIDIVAMLVYPPHHIIYCYREFYGLILDLDRESIADSELILSLDSSVKAVARENPRQFQDFVEVWKEFDAMVVQRLLCRGLVEIAAHHPDFALDFLISDRRRLALGGHEGKFSDSRALIRATVNHLTQQSLQQLEEAVLRWSDYVEQIEGEDPESRFRRRKWDRERRLLLLKTLPFDRLRVATQALISAEEVALTEYRDLDHTPRRGMSLVGSPMSATQMARAKDDDLLNLFNELVDSTEADHPRHPRLGGVEQASMELALLAEQDPERVASILLKLRSADQQKPAAHAIRALGANLKFPTDTLYQLIVDLENAGFHSMELRGEAAHACLIRANEEDGLPDYLCELLEKWLDSWTEFSRFRDDEEGIGKKDSDSKPASILWFRSGVVYPHGSYWLL